MASGKARILVWDWTIRLFHWTLAGLVAALWWTAEENMMDWHQRAGLAVLGLLVFRIYWGVFGSRTAKFNQFIKGPRAILAYLGKLTQRPYKPAFGHNPVGALSVMALLVLLITQVVFGLFAVDVDGIESGPLARFVDFDRGRWFAEMHELTFNILMVFIILHLLAVAVYAVVLKTNLVRPMVTGRRAASDDADLETASQMNAPWWKIVIGVLIAAGTVYGVVNV